MGKKKETTSWEAVSTWYDKSVGEEGHYYHEHVILPKIKTLLSLSKETQHSFLDLACGQGILSRFLPPSCTYTGVDLSPSLIQAAKQKNKQAHHTFLVSDITKPLKLPSDHFDCCAVVLALQNIEAPIKVFQNAYKHLKNEGTLLIVLNHPCFRIPRQSSWGVDLDKKIQYRRIDRYLSPLKIPIQSHPSQGKQSSQTFTFHYSLSQYSQWLRQSGFVLEEIDEWCSDKKSTGKHAKMEDRSRLEFPLFLAMVAKKL